MKQIPIVLAAVTVVSLIAGSQIAAGQQVDPVIAECKVALMDEMELSASELGALTYLGVKEGAEVTEGAEIARIDDRQAILAREVAKYGLRAANQRAEADIEIKYSKAAAEVAKAAYDRLLASNSSKVEKVVPQTELDEARLEWRRAELAIEKAEHDMNLAALEAWVKKAELDAAELAIEQRIVKSPFNGQVAEVYRHQNEWVNKGDPILRLIRLDTLYVDGTLYLDEYNPRDIRGCEVTVEVPVGRGEVAQVPGRIVHVNPELRYGRDHQEYVVRAEVTNRSEQDQWVVLPGQQVTMKIHLGTAAPAVGARNR